MRRLMSFLLVGILGVGLLGFAQQEVPPGRIVIEFWHAFRGALGDLTQQMIDKFNQSQDKYWVVGVYKGSYTETMDAAIAAFRAGKPRILCRSLK